MLKKIYTIVDSNGFSYTNVNMHKVIKERLKLKDMTKSYTLSRINSKNILSDFGVEFLYSKDLYSGVVLTNCKYIIEDGLGNIVCPEKLFREYVSVRESLSKKIEAAVNEIFPFCQHSYGIKKYKRRVKGSYYRKPRTSSLMNELKSLEYSLEFDVNVRKKRIQEITWVTQEGTRRTTKKSWKNYKYKKQWMKGI